MKFFHISDLHIGIKLHNRGLDEDQKYILEQIIEKAKSNQPDAVVIAGDVYDKSVPSAEAAQLFNYFISHLTGAVPGAEIMVISGNHDSAARIDLYRDILKYQKVHMIGEPPRREGDHIEKVTLHDEFGPVNFYLLPFVKPSMVRQIVGGDEEDGQLSYDKALHKLIEREKIDESSRNILVSHQFYISAGGDASKVERMDSEYPTVGNIDAVEADFFSKFDYVALGHIHKPTEVGGKFYRYAGTPMQYSVSEAGQQKGIIEVYIKEKGCVDTKAIPLKPMHEVCVVRGKLDEVLKLGCDDYVKVVLTDKIDFNVFDMSDRVKKAFPNLLEISRETETDVSYDDAKISKQNLDPYEMCCLFLGDDLDDDKKDLLRDVINSVREDI